MQTASALLSDGGAQVWQEAAVPHRVMLSSGKHPLMPGQVWVPSPQTVPQVALLPQAVPVGQGVQSKPFLVPQVAVAVFRTQTPLHRCRPVLHACTQAPAALQVTLPFAGAVQTVQLLPQELTLVLPFTTHELPQA